MGGQVAYSAGFDASCMQLSWKEVVPYAGLEALPLMSLRSTELTTHVTQITQPCKVLQQMPWQHI